MLLPIPPDVLAAQARERTLDMWLGSLGLSAAAVSASFAAYMIVVGPASGTGPAPDRVVAALGMGVAHQVAVPAGPMAAPDAAPAPAIDFTPTGTIADPAGTARPGTAETAPETTLTDFAVRDAFDGTALVEARGTLQVVRPGATIAGAGEVLAIERRRGGWVVTTTGGTIAQRR